MGRRLTFAILPLALAETLIWAATFYSFPALLPVWEADLGWSRSEISTAFTASLIVTALASPRIGAFIDRGFARSMFVGATVAGGFLLVALSQVDQLWQFWVVWMLLGLVNACILYEACFAIITVVVGARAREGITVVTLVAGFAGTVCFPSFHLLSEAYGWREAVLTFAAITVVISAPLASWGLSLLEAYREPQAERPEASGDTGKQILGKASFWYIASGFAAAGLVHSMIISHIRPILAECGLTAAATVLIASMMGPMQVVGRIVMVAFQRVVKTYGATMSALVGIIVGLILLLSAGSYWQFALIFVVPYSASYGIISIVRPVLAAEFLGRAGFGVIAGMLALPYVLAGAIGPLLAAALWSLAGYDLVLLLCVVLIVFSTAALSRARRTVDA